MWYSPIQFITRLLVSYVLNDSPDRTLLIVCQNEASTVQSGTPMPEEHNDKRARRRDDLDEVISTRAPGLFQQPFQLGDAGVPSGQRLDQRFESRFQRRRCAPPPLGRTVYHPARSQWWTITFSATDRYTSTAWERALHGTPSAQNPLQGRQLFDRPVRTAPSPA